MTWRAALFYVGVAGLVAFDSACSSGVEGAGGAGGSSTVQASTSATGTGGGASSTGTGGDTIACDGSYTTIPEGECNQLQQDCDLGYGCKPLPKNGDWTTSCQASSGLKGATKSCMTDTECQPGLFCVFNQCSPVCCPATAEPCNGGTCNVEAPFGPYTTFLCSYLAKCQILTENACAEGTECHIQDYDQGLSMCVPPSGANKKEGEACQYLNDCGEMQICFNSICRYSCYYSAMGQGMPGLGGCPKTPVVEKCMMGQFGIDDVGVCQP